MAFDGVLFSDKGKRLYVLGRAIAIVVSITGGLATIFLKSFDALPYIVDYGPVVVIHEVVPVGIYDDGGSIGFVFDKRRDCAPKSATVVVLDAEKRAFVGRIEWDAPFPIGNGLTAEMTLTFKNKPPPGLYRNGVVEVRHHQCADRGGDPQKPVLAAVPPFMVVE